MMSSREVWPFFFLGFALAAIDQLTLISLGIIGVCLAVLFLALEGKGGNSNGSSNGDGGSDDPLGEIEFVQLRKNAKWWGSVYFDPCYQKAIF